MSRTRASRGPAAPAWSQIIGTQGWIRIAIIAGLIVWLYSDQIARMVRIWWDTVDWSHGFLMLPFSLFFLHNRREQLAALPIRPSWFGLPVVLAGVAAYIAAIYARFGIFQPLSMLVVIAGAVLLTCGWRLLALTAFPIAFLTLGMPPPERRYRELTQPLQQIAAAAAEHVIRAIDNVEVLRQGFHLEVYDSLGKPLAAFSVAGACSGMRSLLAFTALGLAMAFLTPRPMWHRIVIALLVLPIALFCNIVRVVVTGMFMIHQLGNLAEGVPHTLLGILTFGLGLALYSAVLYVLDHLFVAEEEPSDAIPA